MASPCILYDSSWGTHPTLLFNALIIYKVRNVWNLLVESSSQHPKLPSQFFGVEISSLEILEN